MPSTTLRLFAALFLVSMIASPAPAADVRQLEAQMAQLLNQDRAANGLPALAFDDALANVARAHSSDMVRSGNFSHQSPTTGSPEQRLDRAGVAWNAYAENIAFNSSVATAQASLMRSPGHRSNILNGTYDTLGIGIVPNGRQIYVTQMFIKAPGGVARRSSSSRLSGAAAAAYQAVPTREAPRRTSRRFRLFGR